jgi:hypothetical protein
MFKLFLEFLDFSVKIKLISKRQMAGTQLSAIDFFHHPIEHVCNQTKGTQKKPSKKKTTRK